MSKTRFGTKLYRIISPAHRAIWRWGIALVLAMVNEIVLAPAGHKTTALLESNFVILYFLYLIYEVINIVREYRHPRPQELGLSTKGLGLGLVITSVVLTVLDWIVWTLDNQPPQWSGLLLMWGTAVLIYILRPRPPR